MSEQQDPVSRGVSFLPVLLAGIASLFILLVLILLTGGFVFWIVLCVASAAGLASLHWILWGRLLTQLTAGEREEEQLLERARAAEEPERRVYRR
jgi:hypothetical protein